MAGSSVYSPNDPKNPSFVKAADPEPEAPVPTKTAPIDKWRRRALKKRFTPHEEHVLHQQHVANVKNNPQKYG